MRAIIVIILLLVAGFSVQAQLKLQAGAMVFELKAMNMRQINLLRQLAQKEEMKYNFFNYPNLLSATRVLVQPNALENFTNLMLINDIENRIINEDFYATVENELNTQRLLRVLSPYKQQQRLGTERYYSHGEINQYIEDLARRYPNRVYVKTVGKSYEGRLMKTITITNGDRRKNKKVIFIDACIHANEWITPATAAYVIGELVENYSAHAELLLDCDWVILPVVNPDGYEYTQLSAETRLWRKTRQPNFFNGTALECVGTDANRNFDFHWNEEGASDDPCSSRYAGPYAFSEPETIVLRDLIHTYVGRGVFYLTLHSSGYQLMYPWSWTHDLPDAWEDLHAVGKAGANAVSEATGGAYTVGSTANVLYMAAGASVDYAFHAGFPISLTMELPAGGPNNIDPPPTSIDSFVKETWIGIRAMAKKVNEMYPL